MKLIVDASAAASWLLASQATPSATKLLDRLGAFETYAPHVFQWEIGNLLVRQTRREPGFNLNEAFAVLDSFRITLAPPTGHEAVRALAGIAVARGLSLFDAGYLWLAMQTDGALATRDASLLAAASEASVDVFDLRG